MRTTRAFIAGLGTTGSLVAATACAFLVTSTLVAFNGWPGGQIGDPADIGSLLVHEAPVAVSSAGPEGVAAGSTAAAEAVVSTPSRPALVSTAGVHVGTPEGLELVRVAPPGGGEIIAPEGGGGSGGGSGGGEYSGPGVGSFGPEAATTPAAPQAPSAGLPRSPNIGTSVSDTTGELGDTVSGTTNQVDDTVGGPVGDLVKDTGQAVDDLLTGVGQTVGGTLGH